MARHKTGQILYIMIAPIVYLIVFKYLPMGGIVIALKILSWDEESLAASGWA